MNKQWPSSQRNVDNAKPHRTPVQARQQTVTRQTINATLADNIVIQSTINGAWVSQNDDDQHKRKPSGNGRIASASLKYRLEKFV